MSLSILAVFAHPDDEGFGVGGTLAMLVARGHRLTLVCATNGDVGQISDLALATPESLGRVRQQELRDAMSVTGVADLRFLNYRDSGMAGTADNDNPASLYQAPAETVVGRVRDILDEVKPDLVITHDLTGGYGHPDHITISRHTTGAVEGCDPAPLLYYLCFPRSSFQRMWRKMLDLGIKPPFGGDDVELMGTDDDDVTTVKDITEFLQVKKDSVNCHRTQIDPNGAFSQLPEEFIDEIMSTEYFYLVQPSGGPEHRDLLAEIE
jgi:LmbE family N-acetylglucosaminyl deacetylase